MAENSVSLETGDVARLHFLLLPVFCRLSSDDEHLRPDFAEVRDFSIGIDVCHAFGSPILLDIVLDVIRHRRLSLHILVSILLHGKRTI